MMIIQKDLKNFKFTLPDGYKYNIDLTGEMTKLIKKKKRGRAKLKIKKNGLDQNLDLQEAEGPGARLGRLGKQKQLVSQTR